MSQRGQTRYVSYVQHLCMENEFACSSNCHGKAVTSFVNWGCVATNRKPDSKWLRLKKKRERENFCD